MDSGQSPSRPAIARSDGHVPRRWASRWAPGWPLGTVEGPGGELAIRPRWRGGSKNRVSAAELLDCARDTLSKIIGHCQKIGSGNIFCLA